MMNAVREARTHPRPIGFLDTKLSVNDHFSPSSSSQSSSSLMLLAAAAVSVSLPTCPPLLPDAAKLRVLQLHRRNDSAPLAMWRVMKSSTTSMCAMAVHEYRVVRKLPATFSGTCGSPWRDLFQGKLL